MDEDAQYKLRAVQQMTLASVVLALIRSHPDREALKAAWAMSTANLFAFDAMLSTQDDLGRDLETSTLLQREIGRWTDEIHRTA